MSALLETAFLARAVEYATRRLSAEEVCAALAEPISDAERASVRELIAWFTRRYPTPLERLAYVRQAYARWASSSPRATQPAVVRR